DSSASGGASQIRISPSTVAAASRRPSGLVPGKRYVLPGAPRETRSCPSEVSQTFILPPSEVTIRRPAPRNVAPPPVRLLTTRPLVASRIAVPGDRPTVRYRPSGL